ncbi:hypothetical protein D3C79_627950 [compost metagenome]
MLAGIEAQLQGEEIGPRSELLLCLEILRTAFLLAVFEWVECSPQQPVGAGLASNLQCGDRFQIAHRALAWLVAWQAIASQ